MSGAGGEVTGGSGSASLTPTRTSQSLTNTPSGATSRDTRNPKMSKALSTSAKR